MATINMHIKFEIEIPKETWLMLRKPCRLQTDGQTDGQGESSIPPPPSNFVGRGYNNNLTHEKNDYMAKGGRSQTLCAPIYYLFQQGAEQTVLGADSILYNIDASLVFVS